MASSSAAAKLLLPSISTPSKSSQLSTFASYLNPKPLVSFSSSIRAPAINLVSARNARPAVVAATGTQHLMGSLTRTEGLRFAVVVARFNEVVTNLLLEGALETFRRYSVREEDITVVKVPGSFEIPVVAQKLGKSGNFHAILCIGAVIRGDTTHYDAVANSAASGVLSAGIGSGVPCIFGVLTCEDMDQVYSMTQDFKQKQLCQHIKVPTGKREKKNQFESSSHIAFDRSSLDRHFVFLSHIANRRHKYLNYALISYIIVS